MERKMFRVIWKKSLSLLIPIVTAARVKFDLRKLCPIPLFHK
ncbi:hypothetical protein XBKB1_1510021 [Xenorhabdus bovienii str. kraussei Becker Underwood]|uniref:Uncharacterized protein n=1 Tax=Xenorhabdus bovienii str. kraussei Becker Underwood TaxID=1398204 RepID=A0A077PTK5_XENBV|nr:hypothetical protein XBKB1_1510021 [Xenorhabdus bovienii str. kraussei Becker Underwood]